MSISLNSIIKNGLVTTSKRRYMSQMKTSKRLEPDRLKEAYANYNTVFRQMPPPGEELTAEQLTGLDALLKDVSQPVPYLDFGVWGPHHHRLEKKIKLQGSTLTHKVA